jgi:hypothetical protein
MTKYIPTLIGCFVFGLVVYTLTGKLVRTANFPAYTYPEMPFPAP